MKIVGHTLEGDLIIQVSRAEWDGLQDGVRPQDETSVLWTEIEAAKFLIGHNALRYAVGRAFNRNKIDGSIRSLRDIANGKTRVGGIGPFYQAKLRELLDEQANA